MIHVTNRKISEADVRIAESIGATATIGTDDPSESATVESRAENLLKLIKDGAIFAQKKDAASSSGIPRGKSGQLRFKKATEYTTTFKDGTVKPGIHGISMHCTSYSDYDGPRCGNCGRVHDLLKCKRCLAAWYCGRACQANDWPRHKTTCTRTKKK
jgi:hypothetical protein